MSRKLEKFVILFDNTNVLYFPGQFLTGRVIVELNDDTPALGKTHNRYYVIMRRPLMGAYTYKFCFIDTSCEN